MIIHNVEQGSPEWLALRLGKPTASSFKKIITAAGERSKQLDEYTYDLIDEAFEFDTNNYSNSFMQRGHECEEIARMNYEFENGVIVEQVGCIEREYLPVIASPDGLVESNGMWECKSRKFKYRQAHIAYIEKNKKVPTGDFAQVQGQLWVAEREWCDYTIYHPKGLYTFRQQRDDVFINKLEKLVSEVCSIVASEIKNG